MLSLMEGLSPEIEGNVLNHAPGCISSILMRFIRATAGITSEETLPRHVAPPLVRRTTPGPPRWDVGPRRKYAVGASMTDCAYSVTASGVSVL